MLGIIVPVYNEKDNIAALFEAINEHIQSPKSVIIVYDSEDDNTLPVVNAIADKYDFSISMQKNLYGKGALNAIKTGLYVAEGDALLVMMADLSDSLWVVDDMYKKIITDGYDLVCGSRYMAGGAQHGGPVIKGFLSKLAGVSLHMFSGIPTHDITNSFKMYRKTMLKNISIESKGGFEIGMEITVKAYLAGYKVGEVPAEWFDRTGGASNFKLLEWLPHYIRWYLKCLLHLR